MQKYKVRIYKNGTVTEVIFDRCVDRKEAIKLSQKYERSGYSVWSIRKSS